MTDSTEKRCRGNAELDHRAAFPRRRFMMWSGPRSLSTAMMYAFHHLGDTTVVDEPFDARYLHRHPTVEHPGRAEVLASYPRDTGTIIAQLDAPTEQPIQFVKNMPHHIDGLHPSVFEDFEHILLIREPASIILSFIQQVPDIAMRDIAYDALWSMFEFWKREGKLKAVIDRNRLLVDPIREMQSLCRILDIPYHQGMVQWNPGPIAADGIWAPYWYRSVHASDGLRARQVSEPPKVPTRYADLHAAASDIYHRLLQESIHKT